jgi:hypothetical protein
MREPWQDAPLDPGIAPLVRAMNATGWLTTLESCEGHPGRGDNDAPYVVFECADAACVTEWVDRAQAARLEWLEATFVEDVLITATYEGRDTWRLRGQYVSPAENARIIQALREALA